MYIIRSHIDGSHPWQPWTGHIAFTRLATTSRSHCLHTLGSHGTGHIVAGKLVQTVSCLFTNGTSGVYNDPSNMDHWRGIHPSTIHFHVLRQYIQTHLPIYNNIIIFVYRESIVITYPLYGNFLHKHCKMTTVS